MVMARYLDPKYDLTLKRVCGEHKKMPVHGNSILRSMCYPVDIRLSALVILLCLSAFWTAVSAQQAYPVQSYTQVIPPYTPYTPNYYTGMKEKLKVRLINMDMQHPLINVRLRMKITSSFFSIENHEYIYTPAIQLFPGDNITLSLQDLEPYFRSNALRVNGNQTEFSRTRMLPDGQYIFRFDVFEERTGKQLNNPNIGYAIVYIASGDPPRLNLPEKGRIIPESGMTNIMFTWTPRHFNSLAAAYGTEYEFSMVELYDKKMPPEGAFTYSAPFYTELVRPTAFIYNATHPMLKVGHRYAWRVRAVAKDELQDEISVFKNSGYSEVFYFDYTADCKTPTFLGAIVERGRVNITWDDVMATEYTLEYRKKGSLRWTTVPNINVSQAYIYACQYGKEY